MVGTPFIVQHKADQSSANASHHDQNVRIKSELGIHAGAQVALSGLPEPKWCL